MRIRNIKNKVEILNNSKYLINNPKEYKGCWNKVFNNNNPIYVEIGMGKGKFILENALKYENINFIGVEKYDSVIARSIKKIEKYDIPNLRLIRIDAKELNQVFFKDIDLIYLTFSDPWPKERHEKRRLTYKGFLDIYKNLFKFKNKIVLKTDNKDLFEYSVVSLSKYGFTINSINVDLHNSSECDILTTEYEDKFVKLGKPIYKIVCEK